MPWLKYVPVEKLNDQTLSLSSTTLTNSSGDKLGDVAGLIVDAENGKPYYVVADAGGWFKSKNFLAPIGVLRLSSDKRSISIPLTKEQVARYPGFDVDAFDDLTETEIRRINGAVGTVFDPDRAVADEPIATTWDRPLYATPDWWVGNMIPPFPRTAKFDDGNVSPHVDKRAQPGDVLGVETGGERTSIGDTAEDEDDRRRDSEEGARPSH